MNSTWFGGRSKLSVSLKVGSFVGFSSKTIEVLFFFNTFPEGLTWMIWTKGSKEKKEIYIIELWKLWLLQPVDLYWFFEISIRTEKKFQLELKKNFSYKLTEIFFQCSLKFFFSSWLRTEKKLQWTLKKYFS